MVTKTKDTSIFVGGIATKVEKGTADVISKSSTRLPASSIISGEELPGWRGVIARGGNATTSLSVTAYNPARLLIFAGMTNNPHPSQPWRPNKSEYLYWGTPEENSVPDNSPPTDLESSLDRSARIQFVSKYREARTAFQSGVFLGELAQTVRMIKSPVKALREGLVIYHKRVKKRVRGRIHPHVVKRIVGETWLEFAFGWRPLIRDAEAAVRLACSLPDKYRQEIRGVGQMDWKPNQSRITVGSPVGFPYWIQCKQTAMTLQVIYRGAAMASISPPSFPEQLGLSWSNVLPTAWELIPYSFLVDYFTNVGEVIEGISTGRISLSWGARTMRQVVSSRIETIDAKATNIANAGHPNVSSFCTGAGSVGTRKKVVRASISEVSVGLSDFRLEIPGATSLKWLNIAALAALRT